MTRPAGSQGASIDPSKKIHLAVRDMDVFEMHNAKKYAFLAWRPKRTYLCTKYATSNGFGYLVWVCLKCAMPEMPAPEALALAVLEQVTGQGAAW